MTALHLTTRTTSAAAGIAAPRAMPRTALRLLVLGLLGVLVAGCGSEPTTPPAGASDGPERYHFLRARLGLVRADSSTGQIWTVAVNGDGGWEPRGAAPDLAGEPARNGRFNVMNVPTPRNTARVGAKTGSPALMRVDRATGRTWLLESDDATSWMAVGEAGQPPTAEPAAQTPSSAATGTPATDSAAFDASSADRYPILTGDELGVTPEEKMEMLEAFRTARTKQDLPLDMRLWSVRQLGEVEPDLSVPELLEALDDPEPLIVAEAVRQLGRIGRPSTIPRILQLQDHPDAGVRQAVSEVVVEIE